MAPLFQFPAVKVFLGLDHIVDLGCGQHIEETVVIGLLNALQLHIKIVALLYCLHAALFVGGFELTQVSLPLIESPLFYMHLFIQWEELGSLLLSEAGLLSNELLQLSLEPLWREAQPVLLRLGIGYCHQEQPDCQHIQSFHNTHSLPYFQSFIKQA